MEGKKCTKTGLWMVPINNKASPYIANKIGKVTPSVENVGVNQQVKQSMKAHFGGETHCIANAIQTSSNGELANYHHQSLGLPTTWSMLNALKITQQPVPDTSSQGCPRTHLCLSSHYAMQDVRLPLIKLALLYHTDVRLLWRAKNALKQDYGGTS